MQLCFNHKTQEMPAYTWDLNFHQMWQHALNDLQTLHKLIN